MVAEAPAPIAKIIGRYVLGPEIARGGLATVHLGLALGEAGFSRAVAIKRLHAAFASDAELVASFVDEAKLVARIRHPNVVPTLDVASVDGEVFVVMEYVHGESLSALLRQARELGAATPHRVASAIIVDALRGLEAAHEASDDRGVPLGLIHRDVSPQNVLVGADGVARLLDFGIAKVSARSQATREGQVKGKLAYMPPEQLAQAAEQASDLYAAGVCLWEALAMRRLFDGDSESVVLAKVIAGLVDPPSRHAPALSPEVDALVLRAVDRNPQNRFKTAREMADALATALPPASVAEVRDWVAAVAGPELAGRMERVGEVERAGHLLSPPPPTASERGALAPAPTPATAAPITVAEPAPPSASESRAPAAKTHGRRGPALFAMSATVAAVALYAGLRVARVASDRGEQATRLEPVAVRLAPLAVIAPKSLPRDAAPPDSAPASSSASPSSRVAPRIVHAAVHPPATSAGCDPPYSVDPDGTRRYKKACLK